MQVRPATVAHYDECSIAPRTSLTRTNSQKKRRSAARKAAQLTGSGAYSVSDMKRSFSAIPNALKSALAPIVKDNKEVKKLLVAAGASVGGLAGPIGSAAGVHLARRLSKLIGSGDYSTNTVRVNTLMNPSGMDPILSFKASGGASCLRVQHREFLGDVVTSGTAGQFINYSYPINIGLRQTFPFLSQLAANYEEYVMGGLAFEFISTASPYLAGSALGSVVASMEYNPISPAYTSKFQMENSAEAISNRLDHCVMYGVECAKGLNTQNAYLVRTGDSSAPLTATDMGTFQLAVAPGASVPTTSVVGELWVTYDVCLDKPILNMDRTGWAHFTRGPCTTTNIFGSTANHVATTSGVLSGVSVAATVITLPSTLQIGDVVQLQLYWTSGTAGVSGIGAFTLSTGLTPISAILNNTAPAIVAPAVGVTSTTLMWSGYYQITSTQTSYTITANATNTGPFATGSPAVDISLTSYGNSPVGVVRWPYV